MYSLYHDIAKRAPLLQFRLPVDYALSIFRAMKNTFAGRSPNRRIK
jgi:hypothetical protein